MAGYAENFTAQLLRAAVAGRAGYKEGQAAGGAAVAKSAADAREERRKELLAQAQAAIAERTSGLVDPNDPEVLRAKAREATSTHATNRLFDVRNPLPERGGNAPGTPDRAMQRARAAAKAKLMSPVQQRFGPPRPGMSEIEAEELVSQAYGPADGAAADAPDTSTRALMSGSILRGGGAAAAYGKGGSATSTAAKAVKSSSAPANDPKLNVTGGKKTGNIDLKAASPPASAIPTGVNLKERDMSPADLWDKKVGEGMTPDQATAYVHRLKGTG